ncbi:MAG: shikimate dehydrogenase [Rhodoferax sp.]|nr:shikimate dehydrogenase [Rhodoferax sp.]
MENKFVMAGVMGWPVAHSRSPAIHNHWIGQYGLHGAYGLFPVQPDRLADAIRGLRALGLAGCNVTIPHKVSAMQYMDEIDPLAQRMGAINTIVLTPEGALHGFNHDGFGYLQSLHDTKPDWQANAGPVTVLGAGGAARAVVLSLLDAGATEIRLLNRTLNKAQALADEFGPAIAIHDWDQRSEALREIALLVNTTNQGMHGQPALDIQLDCMPPTALVSDIIYTPLETPLLCAARLRGNPTVNGLGMLLNQARPAFRSWFGVMPEITPALHQAVLATF